MERETRLELATPTLASQSELPNYNALAGRNMQSGARTVKHLAVPTYQLRISLLPLVSHQSRLGMGFAIIKSREINCFA